MARTRWTWPLLVVGVLGCTDPGPAEPDDGMSRVAHDYLDNALLIMELNSIHRHDIDWDVFRQETLTFATGARTTTDTYPAIEDALRRIGDGHSFFRGPVEVASAGEGDEPVATLLGDVGYLTVPAFGGGGSDADALATLYHRIIEDVDTLGASCRWIVDLRGNTGGNMWPMLAGVGPILGEGTMGFFVDPDSVTRRWVYAVGQARIDASPIVNVSTPYELTRLPSVAVLTDSMTASSGEAVAVAFRGRENARSFGGATWGVPTANSAFPLGDGAALFLTVATMADRRGTVYGGALAPDESVPGEQTRAPGTDAALDEALDWLRSQDCA